VGEGLRLTAQDLEAEAFRGLPLRPPDFENRVRLLRALRGHPVQAGGATGRLADAEEAEAGLRVSLITPQGLRLVVLREGEEVQLGDAALAARIARAAEALAAARTADERQIEIRLRGAGAKPVRREGERDGHWVLLDYAEIVVHVQHEEARSFYALERLWRDCPLIALPDTVSPGRGQ
jgi:ribosome silencing factor RsfS/YbeB/iojap